MICFATDKDNPSLYHIRDSPHMPDPYLADVYTSQHKGKGTTLVIDNGMKEQQTVLHMTTNVCHWYNYIRAVFRILFNGGQKFIFWNEGGQNH